MWVLLNPPHEVLKRGQWFHLLRLEMLPVVGLRKGRRGLEASLFADGQRTFSADREAVDHLGIIFASASHFHII